MTTNTGDDGEKRNPYILSTATVEIGTEVPQKAKTRTIISPCPTSPGHISEGM
jgi:hypothetical protein